MGNLQMNTVWIVRAVALCGLLAAMPVLAFSPATWFGDAPSSQPPKTDEKRGEKSVDNAGNSLAAPKVTQSAQVQAPPAVARRPNASNAATTTPTPPQPEDAVTLNFVNADIDSVVKAVSEITGKNFVVDPRVKGTVNIVSSRPMSRSLVYDVFLSALRLQGYAAVEERGAIKIVPESDAKLQASPTFGPRDRSRMTGDQIQTRVFTLKYESAAQLVQVLRPLIAPNNTITAYQNNNTLVITDFASNLQRIEKIIDSIDQPSGTDPIVISLQYASAIDVAQTVQKLFGDATQGSTGTADPSQHISITADPRSNSVLARSDNPSRLARLRALVAMLDTPTSAQGNIHVVPLKNAEAVKVAETLRAIFTGEAPSRQQSGSNASSSYGNDTASNNAQQGSMGSMGSTAGSNPNSPSTTPLNNSSNSQQTTGLGSGVIQADAATNSVIITAPEAIYNNLRSVLDKLDVRRAQVYVEALIAEITSDKAAEFGIQWQNLSNAGGSSTQAKSFGGTNFGTSGQNILGISKDPTTLGSGLNIGIVKGTVTLPGGVQVLNIGALVRALETDSKANILSTPTLLTLDNEEARIVVGQNVPFITGQYALTGSTTTPSPFQTIDRQDVGLTLRIKPQISEGGIVRLQIYQEVSSVDSNITNSAGIVTNKRSIESTVLVDDGQIVAIGGLMQDSVQDGVQKAPLLGDIPVIGSLFRYKSRSRTKTNLMVFLRPVVLRDAISADGIANSRYDYIVGEQRKAQPEKSVVLPNFESPTLPQRQAAPPRPSETPAP